MTTALEVESALLGVYRRPETVFVGARGSFLEDAQGRSYLDFTSGIGVNVLGYGSEAIERAIQEGLATGLVHTSNLFRTEPAEELAALLVDVSRPGKVFFANSGAEAIEASLKFSRRWAGSVGGSQKHEVVAFRRGFHGRLFGSLAITDRPEYQAPFRPLMPGAHLVDVGDMEAVAAVVSETKTAAVVIEPVQGEGGVRPVDPSFLQELRALCSERDVALVFDEVQCGLGRTGTLFAFEQSGVQPDVLALAKPLAGGLPMGAVVLADHLAETIQAGDHASTFGGGPLVSGVALAVLQTVSDPSFLSEVTRLGAIVQEWAGVMRGRQTVKEVRGAGLMWGIELTVPAAEVVAACRTGGLLVLSAGAHVLRLLPPLAIDELDLRDGLATIGAAIG